MLQAIETIYCGPAKDRAARISVRCQAGGLIAPWDPGLTADENHRQAAQRLCQQYGYQTKLHGGQIKTGHCVFVQVPVKDSVLEAAETIVRAAFEERMRAVAECAQLKEQNEKMLGALEKVLTDDRLMNAMSKDQARAILDATANAEQGG